VPSSRSVPPSTSTAWSSGMVAAERAATESSAGVMSAGTSRKVSTRTVQPPMASTVAGVVMTGPGEYGV
jgi:hypothetical protein